MIVDGDVGELVSGTVAAAVASDASGDAEAGFPEPAELLDVEVDEFSGCLALVARSWLFGFDGGEAAEAAGLQMRETVAVERPSWVATWLWVWRSRRKASTASAVARGVWLGDE